MIGLGAEQGQQPNMMQCMPMQIMMGHPMFSQSNIVPVMIAPTSLIPAYPFPPSEKSEPKEKESEPTKSVVEAASHHRSDRKKERMQAELSDVTNEQVIRVESAGSLNKASEYMASGQQHFFQGTSMTVYNIDQYDMNPTGSNKGPNHSSDDKLNKVSDTTPSTTSMKTYIPTAELGVVKHRTGGNRRRRKNTKYRPPDHQHQRRSKAGSRVQPEVAASAPKSTKN
ncbi:hypothetical protein EB796_009894 [Bugula neritina]|uniref:Uncharacterized protein n=1 Tax=Bugula neritina TaxID=10212 RepID=A0A7J7JZF7_BUGNE|nr:hypothetical protein EB796_009894 [Bugula neritina]